jgi:predicted Fe-S protein YdhL (DUF1289 family)
MPPPTFVRTDVASPCISLCVLDTSTGWCKGCYRTIDEIAAWGGLDDAQKRAVLASLPARRDVLSGSDDAEP